MSTKAEQKRAFTDGIKADLSLEASNGAITAAVNADKPEQSLYEKHLPEELTIELVKSVKEYDTNFVSATARAATELANEGFAANKELASATLTLAMFGKDSMTVTANRDGALDVTVTNRAVDPTAGELKKVFHDFKSALKEAQAS